MGKSLVGITVCCTTLQGHGCLVIRLRNFTYNEDVIVKLREDINTYLIFFRYRDNALIILVELVDAKSKEY